MEPGVYRPGDPRAVGDTDLGSFEEAREVPVLELPERAQPCQHLSVGLLASRRGRGKTFLLT